MAGRTDNSVVIDAPMDLVWDMTNDVSGWAGLFAEYARSEVIAVEGDTVRFRLTTQPDEDGKQWSWISERTPDPEGRTVTARRLDNGLFEYMNIRWEYTPDPDGVRMRWIQEFTMKPSAPVDDSGAEDHLNRQTVKEMARIKQLVEQAARREAGAVDRDEGSHSMTDSSATISEHGPVFRVLLRAEITEGKEKEFEEVWQEIGGVVTRQSANLGQWLMRSNDEPGVYYIISDWTDEECFREFERSEGHVGHRSKLQPFRTKGSMVTTDVVAEMVKPRAAAGGGRGTVRVALYFRAADEERVEGLVRAYHESSTALLGTPGLLRNELIRNSQEPDRFAVLSEWQDRRAFEEWETGARHKGQTSPIRAFADPSPSGTVFAVYDVVAHYAL